MVDCVTTVWCRHYGAQAVVVSVDPKRVYVADPSVAAASGKTVLRLSDGSRGPGGEEFCWWQVTVKGGREYRDLDAVQLAKVRFKAIFDDFEHIYLWGCYIIRPLRRWELVR
jgi:imidazole glycerol phosphate synthase subunit HisF